MMTDQELEKGLLTLKIIWFAILVSLVAYLLVGLYAGPKISVSLSAENVHRLRVALYAVACIILIATRYVRQRVLAGKAGADSRGSGPRHPALQKYTQATMISAALSEAVGIFGLVLFFMGKNALDLYLLLGVSAIAVFMYRPKMAVLKGMVQNPSAVF